MAHVLSQRSTQSKSKKEKLKFVEKPQEPDVNCAGPKVGNPVMKILEQIYGSGRPYRRVAVFAPHPDDETIGAFSFLSDPHAARFVVFVTDGAPLIFGTQCAKLRYERQKESDQVARLLGITRKNIFHLGIPDQETAFRLPLLVRLVFELLTALAVQVVLTPAYEGGHPDHDSTAFAVHRAVFLLGPAAPHLVEMCLYHGREGKMETNQFLENLTAPEPSTVILSNEHRRLKQKAFALYRSQQEMLKCFSTRVERFRIAPRYDFQSAPHPGKLFYEQFDWKVTGAQWRQLARRAEPIGMHRIGRSIRRHG
jgi:N-acetylglucosamine malate deacetylase 2